MNCISLSASLVAVLIVRDMHGVSNMKTTVKLRYQISVQVFIVMGVQNVVSGLWNSAVLEEDAACVFEFRVLRMGEYGQVR
jgi:hypothetical protein